MHAQEKENRSEQERGIDTIYLTPQARVHDCNGKEQDQQRRYHRLPRTVTRSQSDYLPHPKSTDQIEGHRTRLVHDQVIVRREECDRIPQIQIRRAQLSEVLSHRLGKRQGTHPIDVSEESSCIPFDEFIEQREPQAERCERQEDRQCIASHGSALPGLTKFCRFGAVRHAACSAPRCCALRRLAFR